MPVELVKGDAEWTLRLSGVVDIFDASALHAAALEVVGGARSGIAAGLAGAEAIDTAATQVLLALKRALAADGRKLRLDGVPAPILELWQLAGLGTALE